MAVLRDAPVGSQNSLTCGPTNKAVVDVEKRRKREGSTLKRPPKARSLVSDEIFSKEGAPI
jgi:hypothetical protein